MRRRRFLASSVALLSTPAVSGIGTTHEVFTPLGYTDVTSTHDAVVEGTTAYVAAGDGFATVDVDDPTEPTVLAERRDLFSDIGSGPLEMIFDLAVEDDLLVVAGPANRREGALSGFGIYDVSDPAAPERSGLFRTDYPIHNIALADGTAYLTGNNRRTNPMVAVEVDGPEEVGRWSLLDEDEAWREIPSGVRSLHDIWVQDGRAYIAHWDAGTWIVDVSDPTEMSAVAQVRGRSPEELSETDPQEFIRLPGNDHYVTTDEDATLLGVGAEAWTVAGGDEDGGPGGIELYDISTPTEPQRLARIDPPPTDDATYGGVWTTSHNFDIVGGRLYSSWYRGGVRVHDISDPANPTALAAWEDRDTAEFFTAKKVPERDFFVASSTKQGSGGYLVNSGLYTFSAVDDDGSPLVDPHSSTNAPQTPSTDTGSTPRTTTTTTLSHDSCADHPTCETPYGETTTQSGTPITTDSPVPPTTTERPPEGTTTGDDTATTEGTESGDGPGFGVFAALAGLAGGGWYARRRGRDDRDE